MPPVGFEPTVPAGERPQTYALDRAAIGIDRGAGLAATYLKLQSWRPPEGYDKIVIWLSILVSGNEIRTGYLVHANRPIYRFC
jgi:hypothetical protein